MAAGSPAGAVAKKGGVINIADVQPIRAGSRPLSLGMALEAKIGIALDEHLRIDGAVRIVANDAAFAQRRVFENERPGLLPMALRAILVLPRHGQPARGFHDVHSVRVMALDTAHLSFNHRVMLRKMKFRADFLMALKARFGIFPRIDNELFLAAAAGHGDVLAPGPVAGFAAGLAGHFGIFQAQARMRARRKDAGDIGMTIQTRLVPDVSGALDLKGRNDRPVGGTGIEQ